MPTRKRLLRDGMVAVTRRNTVSAVRVAFAVLRRTTAVGLVLAGGWLGWTGAIGIKLPPPAPAQSGVPEESRAEAVTLLGAATYKVEEGELGLALELARQAARKWPDYQGARSFYATVAPQATATIAAARTVVAALRTPILYQSPLDALVAYLERNFAESRARPGWYDHIQRVAAEDDAVLVATDLSASVEDLRLARTICAALVGFVNAAGRLHYVTNETPELRDIWITGAHEHVLVRSAPASLHGCGADPGAAFRPTPTAVPLPVPAARNAAAVRR